MRLRNGKKAAGLLAGVVVAALALTACADDNEDDNGAANGADEPTQISIGVFEGWEEGVAASFLWANLLEEAGYEVNMDYGDAGVIYTGMAQGQFDISFDAWLPTTHEDYWDSYGDQMEDLGIWFDDAPLTIAVNEDSPAQSLTELADHADEYGNQLVGIEPGAGLTRITEDQVIPTYGLEEMDFVPSSTPAMLAELQGSVDRGENIVVTLWRPHWAYDAFPIRDLEDPENALGDPEQIHVFGRDGFSEDFPEVTQWANNFWLNDEELHSLENIMFFENDGQQNEASVEQWLAENPDWIERLKAGELKD